MSRLALTLLLLVACSGGCARGSDENVGAAAPAAPLPRAPDHFEAVAASPAAAEVAASYRQLTRLTEEPVDVDPLLAMLCIGATANQVAQARGQSGPHAFTSVTIYMNDLGAEAFRGGAITYPVGSVVVKEKAAHHYRDEKAGEPLDTDPSGPRWSKAPDGVGGMIKRAPGYDPAHGDWEYFYRDAVTPLEHGRVTSCVKCHSGAAGTDYVFGGWAHAGRY